MSPRLIGGIGAAAILVGLLAWGATLLLERLVNPPPEPAAVVAPPPTPETAHITATVFHGSADGQALVPVRRNVPFAPDPTAQGREILAAQLAAAPKPYISVIPPGTTLRAFYLTDRGEAFVDLSAEVSSAHPGGSFAELLTVQAIVNAVVANLPSVQRVQILVDGKEVDTIAGHVDIRRPLAPDASLIRN